MLQNICNLLSDRPRDIELMGGDFDKFQRNVTEVIDNALMQAKGAFMTSASPPTTITYFAKFKSRDANQQKPGPATKTKHDFS